MGKKSKRRGGGGGGGKRNAGHNRIGGDQLTASGGTLATADTDTLFSAEEAAALLRVPTPISFKGIISTNIQPDKCVYCLSDLLRCKRTYAKCCGKMCCLDCKESPEDRFFILDLRGQHRCAFCNALESKQDAILKQEAQLGKTWAQYSLGRRLLANAPTDSLYWLRRAASAGHPCAFLELSGMYLEVEKINRDLKLSRDFIHKARSLHPGMGLHCNTRLLVVANAHISDGEEDEANDILLSITRETDESALDVKLCTSVAASVSDGNVSAEMYVRSFCYGRIESALSASRMFYFCHKYALSKLWLDVACKSKSLYTSAVDADTGETMTWADYEEDREPIRSHLREMRNSCGGCGGALSGERRKYCRCCRTYCYCNEDCQKKHWDNGHREECKEVEDHMRNILRAIRLGRFDSLCQTAST